MNVGSLFSGIGGLDLGLERAGMTVRWQSEIDPYASRVLAKHWPDVPNLGDVTTIDWSTVEPVDLICGGYPCQPFSLAGRRSGTDDARHLWPYFADALCVVRPRWALLENVPGHLSMGFGEVLADLAEIGYDTDWDCIPAAAVGAPHLRFRVFIVAHTDEGGRRAGVGNVQSRQPNSVGCGSLADAASVDGARPIGEGDRTGRPEETVGNGRGGSVVADADSMAVEATESRRVLADTPSSRSVDRTDRRRGGERDQWAIEPDVGRVAHGIPSRVDRLKCLGNAVVPQVAEYVGRRIMEAASATYFGVPAERSGS